jgi:sugar phosphate permease
MLCALFWRLGPLLACAAPVQQIQLYLQGFGGPCCARILTAWFASKERGTYWGMWNIAHNLGGFTAPVQFVLVTHQLLTTHKPCSQCLGRHA